MKSIQKMEKIIVEADSLLNEWDEAFDTKDWSKVNVLKRKLRAMIDEHYHRELRGNKWAN